MREYLNKLESAILDLGSEVYSVKSEMRELKDHRTRMQQTIEAIRLILDEKGVISSEDFELALTHSGVTESIDDQNDASDSTFKRPKENMPH